MVLDKFEIKRIQIMRSQGFSINKIRKKTGYDWRTIKKYIGDVKPGDLSLTTDITMFSNFQIKRIRTLMVYLRVRDIVPISQLSDFIKFAVLYTLTEYERVIAEEEKEENKLIEEIERTIEVEEDLERQGVKVNAQ